jgi:hypothetical protein
VPGVPKPLTPAAPFAWLLVTALCFVRAKGNRTGYLYVLSFS